MPMTRFELARSYDQGILSPSCIPIPPHRQMKLFFILSTHLCDSARFIQAYKKRTLITLKLSEHTFTLTNSMHMLEFATWIKSLQHCHSLWGFSLRSHQQVATLHHGRGWSWTNDVSDVRDLQSLALASRHTRPNSITQNRSDRFSPY